MARLSDDSAQWIVLMGFIISFSLFFLAVVLNQSTVVGQTTAEAVSEFPKEDIRGVRNVIVESMFMSMNEPNPSIYNNKTHVQEEIRILSQGRQNAIVDFQAIPEPEGKFTYYYIHYNNGVSAYNESWKFPQE
jgi:hypothetical protein